jgi:DNA-binding beta-propeller fold protein YncE
MAKLGFALTALALLTGASATRAAGDGPYRLDRTLLVGGPGGWDYLTVDGDHHLLYVPRSTHTQVLNASTGKVVADIPGQQRNHGVAIVPAANRGFITDGKDASVTVFDLKTHEALGKVKAADDADGIIYDPHSDKLFVSCGDANALVVLSPDVDPKIGKPDATIDLGGKPEFLTSDRNGRIFVNLEDKDQVAVVDTKEMKVLAKWPVTPGGSPVGLSIDRDHHRLFVGCRNPQKMVVMSTDDGKVLADLPIGAGVDATQFDPPYAMVSCRDGTLAVIKEADPDHFELTQTVQTKPGARTMGLDPTTHTLYLPTAEFLPSDSPNARPTPKPDSFEILVVTRSTR